MPSGEDLRSDIESFARSQGARLVNFCSVSKWDEVPIAPEELRPGNQLPWARSVIVMGVPMPKPMVDSTPSMVHQELYNTANRLLDQMAFLMTDHLENDLGLRASFFPRDCYYSIEALMGHGEAAFSHVLAGYYSGMGTIGPSHNLLTREFGPRVRMVSVFTDAELPYDAMISEDLCIRCGRCLRECPSKCFSDDGTEFYRMDKDACTGYHLELKKQRHWPCGKCIAVCPVGEDARRYRESGSITETGKSVYGTKGS